MKITIFLIALLLINSHVVLGATKSTLMVTGNSFSIPATQPNIEFVSLEETVPKQFSNKSIPQKINLRKDQSSVKHQGQRGGCTFFVASSLAEALIKKQTGIEPDLSEEYIAWASKTKKKMRILDEDSSVAVNLATIQEFGYMLEKDMPYQPSWFNKGQPCEGQKDKKTIDPICYSHKGPNTESAKRIFDGSNFVFEIVSSRSIDIIRSIAKHRTAVHVSIQGHPKVWRNSIKTGELKLTPQMISECKNKTVHCSGHTVIVTGYDLRRRIFNFKNSWGTKWGDKGYGTISFDYMDQLSNRLFLTGYAKGKLNTRISKE